MRPKIISWERVLRYIYKPDTLIVDLREKEEYEKEHITGAWNISYEDVGEHLEQMSNYERVIFYCAHGNHSLMAARELARRGREAYSIAGGYEGRKERNDGTV